MSHSSIIYCLSTLDNSGYKLNETVEVVRDIKHRTVLAYTYTLHHYHIHPYTTLLYIVQQEEVMLPPVVLELTSNSDHF